MYLRDGSGGPIVGGSLAIISPPSDSPASLCLQWQVARPVLLLADPSHLQTLVVFPGMMRKGVFFSMESAISRLSPVPTQSDLRMLHRSAWSLR